jgi:phosphate:Na+ symporter
MVWQLIGSLLGGLGLFLLGMRLMTGGLQVAAGDGLRTLLARGTQTPLRGLLSGFVITTLVQSSSAVTVATLGFVNAGLLSLLQTVYVVFGSNIGSTTTSWLVAMIGFKFDVAAFALPLIGLGAVLQLGKGSSRRSGLGEALAGFGLFFLGIDVLKQAFAAFGAEVPVAELPSDGWGLLLFVAIGFMLTLLMQSSAAAMTIILSAAAGGMVPIHAAAAAVIGANVGTTSTAALAAIGATPNAQRTAAIHVFFNLLTGLVAMVILMPMIDFIETLQDELLDDQSLAASLALFHSVFNILGVVLLWFFAPHLVRWVAGMFRNREEDLGQPVFLDRNLITTPALAVNALSRELTRMGGLVRGQLADAISTEHATSEQLLLTKRVVERLDGAIDDFAVQIQQAPLTRDFSDAISAALEVARYYRTAADIAVMIADRKRQLGLPEDRQIATAVSHFEQLVASLVVASDLAIEEFDGDRLEQQRQAMKGEYQQLSSLLLHAGSHDRVRVREMVAQIDLHSMMRRAVGQLVKGSRALARLRNNNCCKQDESAASPVAQATAE